MISRVFFAWAFLNFLAHCNNINIFSIIFLVAVVEKMFDHFLFHKKKFHTCIGNCFALNNNFYHFNWSEKISFCLWNRAFACHQKRSNISRLTDGSTLALNSYQEIVPIKYIFESDAKKNVWNNRQLKFLNINNDKLENRDLADNMDIFF